MLATGCQNLGRLNRKLSEVPLSLSSFVKRLCTDVKFNFDTTKQTIVCVSVPEDFHFGPCRFLSQQTVLV